MAQIRTTTITSGQSVSSAVEIEGRNIDYEIGSLVLEGTYTNSSFDIQAEIDGTWFDIYDTFGNKYSVTVATGKHSLPADVFKDVNKVRLKGSQNEASERTAKFLLIDILN
jgi:hypothetical protein